MLCGGRLPAAALYNAHPMRQDLSPASALNTTDRQEIRCPGCYQALVGLGGDCVRLDACDEAWIKDLCLCCHWDQSGSQAA